MIEALLVLSVLLNFTAGCWIWLTIKWRRFTLNILRERIAQLEKENTALKILHKAALRQLTARDEIDVLDAEEIG